MRNEGLHPRIRAAFADAIESDEPYTVVPQHGKKRAAKRGLGPTSRCGVTGQLAATESAVTCPECKALAAKRDARRRS